MYRLELFNNLLSKLSHQSVNQSVSMLGLIQSWIITFHSVQFNLIQFNVKKFLFNSIQSKLSDINQSNYQIISLSIHEEFLRFLFAMVNFSLIWAGIFHPVPLRVFSIGNRFSPFAFQAIPFSDSAQDFSEVL